MPISDVLQLSTTSHPRFPTFISDIISQSLKILSVLFLSQASGGNEGIVMREGVNCGRVEVTMFGHVP